MNDASNDAELALWKKRADRERRARLAAESLAETGTRQLYEKQREFELLHQISSAANLAKDVEDCLQNAVDLLCAHTGWPLGHAYLATDQDPPQLVSARVWHIEDAPRFAELRSLTEQTVFPSGVGLGGRVLSSGRAAWIVDVLHDGNFPRAKMAGDMPVHGAFGFPVLVGDQVAAVLELFSLRAEEPDEALLALASQVGVQLGRVFERRRAEELNRELIQSSRAIGMAEIATGVLHNVGNVLNSVNVSATLAQENLQKSKSPQVAKAAAFLREHHGLLGDFFASHPKGKNFLPFVEALGKDLGREHQDLLQEIASLRDYVDHIKQIVAAQQAHAKVSGVLEPLALSELVEDALRLGAGDLSRHQIELVRDFQSVPPVVTDRHKVLQVLVNLIANARHALQQRPENRLLTLRITPAPNSGAKIQVADNGIGIPPENLTRIFQHGFTTKLSGHGFGLHSGANVARELGGSLIAESDGLNQGARFTLELASKTTRSSPLTP